MSISPESGHLPYVLFSGSIHTAGHNQSPLGNFAFISTLPYLMPTLPLVLILALMTGLTTVPHALDVEAVHADPFWVNPLGFCLGVRTMFVVLPPVVVLLAELVDEGRDEVAVVVPLPPPPSLPPSVLLLLLLLEVVTGWVAVHPGKV